MILDTRLRLELPRETGIILRCAVKVGKPLHPTPGTRRLLESSSRPEQRAHKIKSSLAKVGAAPESLPEITTEAQASGTSLAKVSSAESSPGSHALEDKGTATWSLTAWVSEVQAFEARAVRAQAWETQAFEAQSRASHPKATPVPHSRAAPQGLGKSAVTPGPRGRGSGWLPRHNLGRSIFFRPKRMLNEGTQLGAINLHS